MKEPGSLSGIPHMGSAQMRSEQQQSPQNNKTTRDLPVGAPIAVQN